MQSKGSYIRKLYQYHASRCATMTSDSFRLLQNQKDPQRRVQHWYCGGTVVLRLPDFYERGVQTATVFQTALALGELWGSICLTMRNMSRRRFSHEARCSTDILLTEIPVNTLTASEICLRRPGPYWNHAWDTPGCLSMWSLTNHCSHWMIELP